ncbi:MAG TPA: FKBP-type peptidyl-prolyl cis-trans isomerase, partial [Flavobacterium sp.]|nr:FKBP-type peptidyl-prolyl cis-trans isomerase [Flavobacterium sp.]
FLENGTLFDSSIEEVAKAFGKYDGNRAAQNGYQPLPFQAGKKDGMIPGFIEGLEKLSFGDKAVLFIPSKLGYGEAGAGDVIPPNANIIFEIELMESVPQ